MATKFIHPTNSIAVGSSNYYCCIFLPEQLRQHIHGLFSLNNELINIPSKIKDATVANTKLNWWMQDIERMYQKQAQHPILQQLTEFILKQQIDKSWLLNIVMACLQDVEQTRYLDEVSLEKYAALGCGAFYTIIAQALTSNDELATFTFNPIKFGQTIRLAQIIINVGEDATKGRLYLPSNQLKQFNLMTKDILNKKYNAQFIALMQTRTQQISTALVEFNNISKQLPKNLGHFISINCQIYLKQLQQIKDNRFNILQQHIDITPLHKYYLAIKSRIFY